MLLAIVILGLIGCAGSSVPPDWQLNAHGALRNSVTAYLVGNSKLADIEFARVREEIASTGRADLLARAELVRCAAHVASLEFNDCEAFQKLAEDAADSERVYAEYLAGRWTGLNTALLPLTPNVVTIATQTASDQGWRRPLLAWLNVAVRSAEQLGDKDEALRIQRRIDLVLEVAK
jgi:hypothetical protein